MALDRGTSPGRAASTANGRAPSGPERRPVRTASVERIGRRRRRSRGAGPRVGPRRGATGRAGRGRAAAGAPMVRCTGSGSAGTRPSAELRTTRTNSPRSSPCAQPTRRRSSRRPPGPSERARARRPHQVRITGRAPRWHRHGGRRRPPGTARRGRSRRHDGSGGSAGTTVARRTATAAGAAQARTAEAGSHDPHRPVRRRGSTPGPVATANRPPRCRCSRPGRVRSPRAPARQRSSGAGYRSSHRRPDEPASGAPTRRARRAVRRRGRGGRPFVVAVGM